MLLLPYAAAVPSLFPAGGESQDEWQENTIRVQRYADHCTACAVVITGSSMAARLPPDALGTEVCNVAMVGDGAQTGLEVVDHCPAPPRMVLVEANDTVLKLPDQRILERVYRPLNARLRRRLPIIGDAYQPVSILFKLLRWSSGSNEADDDPRLTPALARQLFEREKLAQEGLPDPRTAAEQLQHLEVMVQRLTARGARVAFFEVPVAVVFEDSPRRRYMRAALAEHFPPERYLWLPRRRALDYATRDGIHLNANSASKFATLVHDEVAKVAATGPLAVR